MFRRIAIAGTVLLSAMLTGVVQADAHPAVQVENAKNTAASAPQGLICTAATIDAQVCFQPQGDKFWVIDLKTDSHHVAAGFNTDYLHVGECHNYHGLQANWTVCDQFSTFILEGEDIYFTAYVMEGDRILARSGERRATS